MIHFTINLFHLKSSRCALNDHHDVIHNDDDRDDDEEGGVYKKKRNRVYIEKTLKIDCCNCKFKGTFIFT